MTALLSSALLATAFAMPFPQPLATAKPANCSIPRPCAVFSNASSGAAVQASSAGGFAIFGESGSGSYLAAAVDGESSNQTGDDAGATFGIETATGANPAYGALGYGTADGLYGETESTTGSGAGVYGYDAGGLNAGVLGQSAEYGVIGLSGNAPRIYANVPIGVAGISATPKGIYGSIGIYAASDYEPLLVLNDQTNMNLNLGTSYDLIDGGRYDQSTVFQITNDGSEVLNGTLTTSKGVYIRTRGASGVTRDTYGPRATRPEVEDVGEAQLTNGRAAVHIDSALADSIDSRAGYHVFVTPEGDCKGLYVTAKTASGFVVRELQGGRSSLAFEYRLVAKPVDAADVRLAVVPPANGQRGVLNGSPRGGSSLRFMTPEARLKRDMGANGFARAVAARRALLVP